MVRGQPHLGQGALPETACLPLPAWPLASLLMAGLLAASGCVQHRTAVSPPVPADPPPAGEAATRTQLIAGSAVINEPHQPVTEQSSLPIDVPVSAWRRDGAGVISRGDLRVTTALPWWQRFPADIVSDLLPIDAEVFASGTATLTPVAPINTDHLFEQAARDGYARTKPTGTRTP